MSSPASNFRSNSSAVMGLGLPVSPNAARIRAPNRDDAERPAAPRPDRAPDFPFVACERDFAGFIGNGFGREGAMVGIEEEVLDLPKPNTPFHVGGKGFKEAEFNAGHGRGRTIR